VKGQFQVWRFDFAGRGEHPCVLISPSELCARAKYVNILYCTSQRQSRPPKPHEVLLNGADGMEWETFVDCSAIWLVESDNLFVQYGTVTLHRRNAIRDMLRNLFRLSARD
jgi:mRNA-degrading endonuclease toxin of MazEF toxin-antitoxin module